MSLFLLLKLDICFPLRIIKLLSSSRLPLAVTSCSITEHFLPLRYWSYSQYVLLLNNESSRVGSAIAFTICFPFIYFPVAFSVLFKSPFFNPLILDLSFSTHSLYITVIKIILHFCIRS